MKNKFLKVMCLIFVSAILMSTISATDIIAGTTAVIPPDVEPNAPDRCYVEVIISGEYIEHWDSGVMYETSFSPDSVSDVYYNGHSHVGTLTTWQLWDNGSSKGYDTVRVDAFKTNVVYPYASAKFSGYLVCS